MPERQGPCPEAKWGSKHFRFFHESYFPGKSVKIPTILTRPMLCLCYNCIRPSQHHSNAMSMVTLY